MMDMDKLMADAEAPVQASNDEVKEIGRLVQKAVSLQDELAALQEMQKTLTAELLQLTERDIPAIMDEAGTSEFKDAKSGKKVTLKDDVHTSISKDNKAIAHGWLRDHDHNDLIKNVITVPIDKGLDNVATQIVEELRSRYGIDAERTESVHASTLKAFVKEQLGKGVEVPAVPFGIHIRRVAVIK